MFCYFIIVIISFNVNSTEEYSRPKYNDPIKTITKKHNSAKTTVLDIHKVN